MLFWLLFGLMTAAAVFAVLWPLSRWRENPDPARETGLAVYRDQFAEIERDRARNLIGEPEAKFASAEVGRRLLAAADTITDFSQNSIGRRRAVALIALAGIPAISLGLYFLLGSPDLSGAPLSARLAAAPENQDIALLVRRVELHLGEQPDDGRGWEIIAPIYQRMGRTSEAVKARENALRLLGPTADREADFGEALVDDSNGMVTADARAAFERAYSLDARNPKARFFMGLAAEQDGRLDAAKTIWQALANDAPKGAPWLGVVQTALARLQTAGQKPMSGQQ
jgi:cytochrome c-type biogenesis protein CcmH